jgi:tetratricopeptide (TPR) repeat protein
MSTVYKIAEAQGEKEMPCLTFEQMLGYVEKNLPPAKRVEVEKHLTSCEFCSEALEGFATFPEKAKLQSMVESLNEQIKARYATETAPEAKTTPISKRTGAFQSVLDSVRERIETIVSALTTPNYGLKLAYGVATVFLVGVVSVLYWGRETANEKLFAEYYQPYPNIASSVRGELIDDKLQDALQQYDADDFKAALALLQEILVAEPENIVANFYAGVCYLKLEKPSLAIAGLQKVIAANDERLAEPAEWYLALAYLQQNDAEKTRASLNGIIAKKHIYKDQATTLLERLPFSDQ